MQTHALSLCLQKIAAHDFPATFKTQGAVTTLIHMNRKATYACLTLLICCFAFVETAWAQEITVGVAVGNSFQYFFVTYFHPSNPNATVPPQLVEDNKTEWLRFTIMQVENTNVTYSIMQRFVNQSVANYRDQANVATGEESGFPIVRANLSVNETLYPSDANSPRVNETLTHAYTTETRTLLHVTWSTSQNHFSLYFDQKTGMPVELHILFAAGEEGNGEYVYLLSNNNVWTIPEFPTFIVLPLLAVAVLAMALFLKRHHVQISAA